MARSPDTISVELIGAAGSRGVLDNFTSVEIVQDITAPTEASFELGNDGTWSEIEQFVSPGAQYRVIVNDRPILTGRVEVSDVPLDAAGGSVTRFVVRTKLADAMYASAAQTTRVRKTNLDEFIFALYAQLGYTPDDFIFRASASRDLITGRSSGNNGPDDEVELERIKIEEARVNPPESIYAAADRHLRRHGLMHWDAPDGRIVVGAPNDEQDPVYFFNNYRSASRSDVNNVLAGTRALDYSGIPSIVGVFGVGGKRDYTRARVSGAALDLDVIGAGFQRPLTIIAEGIRNEAAANAAAQRELTARSKQKDTIPIEVDGLSWWSGRQSIAYAVDTVASVSSDVMGGDLGAYYVHHVTMRRDAATGDTTNLVLLRRGIWKLIPEVRVGRAT